VVIYLDGTDNDGNPVSLSVVTGPGGEYKFDGVAPGNYTVTEDPPSEFVQTTANPSPINLSAGEAYVAEDGASGFPPGILVEITVPELAFGNTVPGSIHGLAFEDADGDGVFDSFVDSALPGAGFTLTGVDGMGNPVGPVTASADAGGQFWFEDLIPGAYTVVFSPPLGTVPTTPTTTTLTISSRQEYVWADGAANLPPGSPRVEINIRGELTFGAAPIVIDLEKLTNGVNADDPNGPMPIIAAGNPVTWSFAVANNGAGAIPAAAIDLADSVLGDLVVSGVSQAGVAGPAGDDGDGVLEPGEIWIYEFTDVAEVLATSPNAVLGTCDSATGQPVYENIGTLTVAGQLDSDPSHYCNPLNAAPVAQDDDVATDEDVPLNGNVLADNGNGADADPDGDPLTVTTTPVSDVAHGVLTLNSDGSFTYTPDLNFNGTDSFEYEVCDDEALCDTATVNITVNPINDPPEVAPTSLSYNLLGNVGIDVPAAGGLLGSLSISDVDSAGPFTVENLSATSGTLTPATDGSFTYDPAAGFTGFDNFTYDVCDNGSPLPKACTSVSVTLTVADMIWFIDNSAGGTNDGTLANPFQSIAAFNAAAGPAPGDNVYLAETGTSYSDGIVLANNQRLIGEGTQDSDLQGATGVSVPPHSNALPPINGTRPLIATTSTGVDLATGNTVRGINVSTSGATGVLGTSVGTLLINDVESVATAGARALDLAGGSAMTVDIAAVTVTGSASGGINLSNNPGSTTTLGNVQLTTTGGTGLNVANSGTVNITNAASAVSSTAGRAVNVSATDGTMSFATLSSDSAPTSGVRLVSTTITFDVSGPTTITNRGATGMEFNAVSGTVGFGSTAVSNGLSAGGDGIRLDSSSAAFTFDSLSVSDTVIGVAGTYSATTGVPTNDGDGNGVFIKNHSGSFAINGGTIDDFADNAIDIRASRDISLSGVTIDGNFAGNSAIQGHNILNFSMVNTTIDDLDNVNAAALVGDHGLRFIELEGTLSITGMSEITDVEGFVYQNATVGSANRAIEVQNRQGCTVQDATGDCNLTVNIDGLTVRNFDFQGVNIRHVGGTSDITVQNSTFTSVNGAAINTGPNAAAATNTHDVDVLNNTFTNVGIAAELFSSRGGPTTAVVSGNNVNGTHGDAIRLVAFNQAGGGPAATFTGTVSNNVMTGVAGNNVAGASGGVGVFIAAEDAVDAQVLVENNSITGHTGTAPVAECFRTQNQRSGVLDVLFRGNSCIDFPTNFFGAVYIGNDDSSMAAGNTDTCVDFAATNTYSNTNGLFLNTFATDSLGTSILDLPNGFNADLLTFLQLDFGDPPTTGACSIAPLSP
jgi:hypothetical protein